MLYFSYGSNMSQRRLQRRTPSARLVTTAVLPAHQLRFHKRGRDGSAKCDALHTGNPEDLVHGVVFRLAAAEKTLLDRHEGLGRGYALKTVCLLSESHGPIEAFTYCATAIDPSLAPFHWYKEHVLRGCQENTLPADYIAAIRLVGSVSDPDPARAAHELAIYRQYLESDTQLAGNDAPG